MTDLGDEVRTALKRIVENLKAMAERKPDTPVGAEDFNSLLARSKKAFPNLPTVQEMKAIDGGTNLGDLLLKVSMLQGAVEADWVQRIADANRSVERRVSRSSYLDR